MLRGGKNIGTVLEWIRSIYPDNFQQIRQGQKYRSTWN